MHTGLRAVARLGHHAVIHARIGLGVGQEHQRAGHRREHQQEDQGEDQRGTFLVVWFRSEEHTSELQSQSNLVCRLLLEKKNTRKLRVSCALYEYSHLSPCAWHAQPPRLPARSPPTTHRFVDPSWSEAIYHSSGEMQSSG